MDTFTRNTILAVGGLTLAVGILLTVFGENLPTREGIKRFIQSARPYPYRQFALIIVLIGIVAVVALTVFWLQVDDLLDLFAKWSEGR